MSVKKQFFLVKAVNDPGSFYWIRPRWRAHIISFEWREREGGGAFEKHFISAGAVSEWWPPINNSFIHGGKGWKSSLELKHISPEPSSHIQIKKKLDLERTIYRQLIASPSLASLLGSKGRFSSRLYSFKVCTLNTLYYYIFFID